MQATWLCYHKTGKGFVCTLEKLCLTAQKLPFQAINHKMCLELLVGKFRHYFLKKLLLSDFIMFLRTFLGIPFSSSKTDCMFGFLFIIAYAIVEWKNRDESVR